MCSSFLRRSFVHAKERAFPRRQAEDVLTKLLFLPKLPPSSILIIIIPRTRITRIVRIIISAVSTTSAVIRCVIVAIKRIISKGISAEESTNTYRGLVKIMPSAEGARNHSQCDSLLVGDKCSANTYPYIEVKNKTATLEHEASTSRISEDQIFYLQSRGLDMESSISMLVNGFCKDVFKELPLEFSVEAVKLIEMKLENSVG